MLPVLVLAHNSFSQVKKTIDSIRKHAAQIEDLQVIVVDNASTDGLSEWIKENTDLSYVYFENGMEPWGRVLNQVIKEFDFDSYFIILRAGFMITPYYFERLSDMACSYSKTCAIASIVTNSDNYSQQPISIIDSYEKAVAYSNEHFGDIAERTMGINTGAVMLSVDSYEQISGFQDDIWSLIVNFKILSIKLLLQDIPIMICRSAVLYGDNDISYEHNDSLIHYGQDCVNAEDHYHMHYFNVDGNMNLLPLIEAPTDSSIVVMEIGCDCGATLNIIKNNYPNSITYGVDIAPGPIEIAKHIIDKAFVANIEAEDLDIPESSFDYIIFGDVLEHLHDPLKTLRYAKKYLKKDGKIIASIPNLMNISVMKQLIHGDFTYTETGLLDKTHIHFFTYNEIKKIFKEAGFNTSISGISSPISTEDSDIIDKLLQIDDTPERFMYETFQYLVRADQVVYEEDT